MDNLFGVPLTSIMVGLLLLMGSAFGLLAWIAFRNPLLVRMGMRNIRRRKAQTALIVVGLMLSTLIVSAAFSTGDTVGYSVTNSIYEQLEEVDFLIGFDAAQQADGYSDDTFLEQLRVEFGGDPGIDGITGTLTRQLPVVNQQQRLSEPSAMVVGVDPASAESFKGLRRADGDLVSADALGGSDVFVTERLVEDIGTGVGGTITLFYENTSHDFRVLDVVRDTSVTAQGNTLVGGVVMNLAEMRTLIGEPNELSNIVVSLTGGTRGTLDQIDPMQTRLETFIDAHPEAGASVDFTKKELVGIGELVGSAFVTIFLVFGLFSMAAGILLVFLIFVMLAAERRSEMGMARAIGMSRVHLTETFIAEGMAYNVGSALVGALLGLAVSYGLIVALRSIFAEVGFDIAFHVNPQGFVISYAAGVVVTFVTVAFSSWRAANLNIVRAIRDLPEPAPFRTTRPSVGSLVRAALGALWYVAWIVLISLWAAAGFALFIFALGFYGLPFLALFPAVGFYVFGVRAASRPLAQTRGWRRALYALWWLVFNVFAVITWLLLRSRGWANRYRNAGGWALVMLVIGVIFIYLGGWVWHQAFAYTAGTTLAVLAVAMLAVYFGAASRPAFTIAGALLVWYWLLPLPFSLMWDAGKGWNDPLLGLFGLLGLPKPDAGNGNIEMFFVSGISITASATLVVIFNAGALLTLVALLGRWLGGIAPAVRTAVAYPLAARFRTAMTLAMFGLVVFSLVVMAFLNYNFTQLFLGDGAKVGFDVRVFGNPSNRIPDLREAVLARDPAALDDVAGFGTTVSSFPFIDQEGVASPPDANPKQWRYIGADDEFYALAQMPLSRRAIGYDSDQAVFDAIKADPSLVIGTEEILYVPAGPFGDDPTGGSFQITQSGTDLDAAPWEPIALNLRDSDTGATRQVKIIAFSESQVSGLLTEFVGLFTTRAVVNEFSDGGFRDNWFVTTVDGRKDTAKRVANSIESSLLEQGVQADSLDQIIDDATAQSTAFQYLFQGFMGLGLVVGIAALGVIAFRTVVERRQQIGMLRAIGYSRRLVGLSFFLESSFIAITGIAMGMLLGGALSYNLLSNPENIGAAGADINFQVPWLQLTIIATVAYVASALMTLAPARSAGRVTAAEALRYE